MALPRFGATPDGTIRSFDKRAIASDCFFSANNVFEKHGFATGESTWIERRMVRRFLEEVRLGTPRSSVILVYVNVTSSHFTLCSYDSS